MKRLLLYVSGPYGSIGTPEDNTEKAKRVAVAIWNAGHAAICPHTNTFGFEKESTASYEDYIAGDLLMVAACDGMVMLPNWAESKGAKIEWGHAQRLGKPIWIWPDLPPPAAGLEPENILEEAKRLVHGPRQAHYGHPLDDFGRTAKIWEAILGCHVEPEQVALCMIGVKLSRETNKPKRDNVVDLAGYAATLELIANERQRRQEESLSKLKDPAKRHTCRGCHQPSPKPHAEPHDTGPPASASEAAPTEA